MTESNDILASAYLDGELTDDERRVAEADPAVMAEIEQMYALRRQLADVEPPSVDARERAIAAALGTFAELNAEPTPGAAPVEPVVVDLGRRRDPMRWLGVAAAVLVIGVLGVVLAAGLGGRGDSDDSASVADEAAEEPATDALEAVTATAQVAEDTDAASRLLESEGGDDGEAEFSTADEPALAAAEEPADAPTESPADEPASEAADVFADDSSTEADLDDTGSSPATLPAAALLDPEEYLDGRVMQSPEALVLVAEHLLALVERSELPPTPNHSCPFPDVLARGLYDDQPIGDPIEIYLSVDTEAGVVMAIDAELCGVLLATELDP